MGGPRPWTWVPTSFLDVGPRFSVGTPFFDAIPEVPYLCHFRRSVDITPVGPYGEIADWMRNRPETSEQSWRTLSYVDCMNLADRIRCKTVVTVGLWDDICPPSSVFAAYNRIESDKQIEVYEFMGHESPICFQETRFEVIRRHV